MIKNKLRGFTLAEMLVVLVVASIVISMGFLVLNMVRKQVKGFQQNYQKKQEIQFFETTMVRDFNRRSVFFNKQLNVLFMKNTKDTIQYQFFNNLVIREKDTFKIEIVSKKLFLEGFEVKENSIDALQIGVSENFGSKQIFMYQTKDAAYYLNK